MQHTIVYIIYYGTSYGRRSFKDTILLLLCLGEYIFEINKTSAFSRGQDSRELIRSTARGAIRSEFADGRPQPPEQRLIKYALTHTHKHTQARACGVRTTMWRRTRRRRVTRRRSSNSVGRGCCRSRRRCHRRHRRHWVFHGGANRSGRRRETR